MLILVSRGTSAGTTILTSVRSRELITVPRTRAPRGLCHLLVFSSLPLPGSFLQHSSVPDPLVNHHPDPDVVCHHASVGSSSSDRHISFTVDFSFDVTNTAPLPLRANIPLLCSCGCATRVSRCPGVATLFHATTAEKIEIPDFSIKDGLGHATNAQLGSLSRDLHISVSACVRHVTSLSCSAQLLCTEQRTYTVLTSHTIVRAF